MNVPYISKWPEALAIMSYPQNALSSLELGLELVDSMWHASGDKSVDINWYTKRVSLYGIYKSTELAMMQDKSEGHVELRTIVSCTLAKWQCRGHRECPYEYTR